MRKLPLLVLGMLLFAPPLIAHREDFIGETLVFLTLERHSLEPELFVDTARGFRMYNAALEYGITDYLMVDGRATWDRERALKSARFEARRRFSEEGVWPVDIAVSLEANFETEEGGRRYGIEPRLILSKDVKRFNVTVNLAEEIPTDGGSASFRVASGVRFDASNLFRVGTEYQYDFRARNGSVIPQIWLTLPHEVTIKAGYFASYRGSQHFFRAAVEFEF